MRFSFWGFIFSILFILLLIVVRFWECVRIVEVMRFLFVFTVGVKEVGKEEEGAVEGVFIWFIV